MTEGRYFSALYQRENYKTKAEEWVCVFKHSSNPKDGRTVWFDMPSGQSWWTDPAEHRWFCLFIERKQNIAVRFCRLEDATGFLKSLEGAQIKAEKGPTPFDQPQGDQDAE